MTLPYMPKLFDNSSAWGEDTVRVFQSLKDAIVKPALYIVDEWKNQPHHIWKIILKEPFSILNLPSIIPRVISLLLVNIPLLFPERIY